jgi:hypothetical protein
VTSSNEVAIHSVWESEEWLKQYAKPVTGAGGEEETPSKKKDLLTWSLGLRGQRDEGSEAIRNDDGEETNDVAGDDQ